MKSQETPNSGTPQSTESTTANAGTPAEQPSPSLNADAVAADVASPFKKQRASMSGIDSGILSTLETTGKLQATPAASSLSHNAAIATPLSAPSQNAVADDDDEEL